MQLSQKEAVTKEKHYGVNLASTKNRVKIFTTPIIAGKYKGKKIAIPAIDTTRSSKSILRESLFNSIAYDVVDANFVELFSGSGSVGLEALSRGAVKSYFLEQNPTAYKILQDNIANIAPDSSYVLRGDAFELFGSLYKQLKAEGKDTFFYFDPPFSIRDGMEDIYDKCINLIAQIQDPFAKMVIVEHMTNIDMPETIGKLTKQKRKKFGKSSLTYYTIED